MNHRSTFPWAASSSGKIRMNECKEKHTMNLNLENFSLIPTLKHKSALTGWVTGLREREEAKTLTESERVNRESMPWKGGGRTGGGWWLAGWLWVPEHYWVWDNVYLPDWMEGTRASDFWMVLMIDDCRRSTLRSALMTMTRWSLFVRLKIREEPIEKSIIAMLFENTFFALAFPCQIFVTFSAWQLSSHERMSIAH